MATLATLVQRVRNELYGSMPHEAPFATQITASYTSGATSIAVTDGNHWAVGDIVENLDNGDQMLVTAISTNTLTVVRNFNGTTAAASSGSADVILRNPRFTYEKIKQALFDTQSDFESWGIHEFAVGTITRADPKEFYELSETDIVEPYGVLKIYEVETNSETPQPLPFRYQRRLGTGPSEYSVGAGVEILDWGNTADGSNVHFIYAQKVTADATGTATISSRREDIAVIGAAARLLGGTLVPATQDPGARTDRTVQPGQTGRDWRVLQARFISQARVESALLQVERQRLLAETPRLSRARRWRS